MAMDTRYGFTEEQISVIKATIAPGATNDELALFLMVCQKTGLDPFSRQIYLSERRQKDKLTGQWTVKKTPETTIDGFRVIAERSNEYEGQVGPLWCGPDGVWQDIWLAMDTMPTAAKVGVWRKGFREPLWGKALFEEYKQTTTDGKLNSMWQKMGANQLAKCAEALALRKAFPRDLSGLYAREEMGQSDNGKEAQQDVAQRKIKELSISPLGGAPAVSSAPRGIIEGGGNTEESAQSYQQRHTALILEANAVLDEAKHGTAETFPDGSLKAERNQIVDKPPARKRGTIAFKDLKSFKPMKEELSKIVGDDHEYYDMLKLQGVSHADELNAEQAKPTYKLMAERYKQLKKATEEKDLLIEAQKHALRIGAFATQAALERHGLQDIEEILNADGTTLTALLKELRETA
jgi:phage recombination protein Bet